MTGPENPQDGATDDGVGKAPHLFLALLQRASWYVNRITTMIGPENPQDGDDQDGTDDDGVGKAPHLFLALSLTACAAFFIWASYGVLDIVSTAMGEVIPSSQVKSIQHLEGGIVREILVREGEVVKKGQPLVVLEPTASDADVGEIRVNVTALRLEIARLQAAAAGTNPTFPEDLLAEHPEMVRQTLRFFQTRKKRRLSELTSNKEEIVQRRQEIKEISVRLENRKRDLELQEEKIAIGEELLKEKLSNRYTHLDLMKEESRLKGLIDEDTVAGPRAEAALKKAEADFEGIQSSFEEETRKELETARLKLNELMQRMQKFEDRVLRKVLRSPVDGVIKTLSVVTLGGVLGPGETVAEVVPGGDRLIIEAKLPTQDIGYIRAGQPVLVKLASADAARFGGLDGKVVNISPDTLITPEGVPYYKVRIATEKNQFQHGTLLYRLYPGMQVVASIRTGTRSVLEYILDPFLRSMEDAMRER